MSRDLVVAVRHALTITKLITRSTGITSHRKSFSHIIVRNRPLPTADIIPVGPFQLSNQPAVGSLKQAITVKHNYEIRTNTIYLYKYKLEIFTYRWSNDCNW